MIVPEGYNEFGHLSDDELIQAIIKETLMHTFEDGWFHNVARFNHGLLRPLRSKRRLHQLQNELKRRQSKVQ